MKGSKITFIIMGIIVVVCVAATIYDMRITPEKSSPNLKTVMEEAKNDSKDWEATPTVIFADLDGKSFTLDEFKGKVVLLNFWATWCPPCAIEFPSLLRLMKRHDGKVILVAVSNDDEISAIYKFLKNFENEFPEELKSPYLRIAWDKDRKITSEVFNTDQFPETIIISPDTRMARKVVGDIEWNSQEITDFLDSLQN